MGNKNLVQNALYLYIDYPPESRDDGLCLTCHEIYRERFSWFCSDRCERTYIDEQWLA